MHTPCLTCFGCSWQRDILQGYKSGESNWPYIFSCMVLKSSLLHQMAPDHLQVVHQPTRICGNLSACLFATQDMLVSANISSRLFVASNRVKTSGCTWAQLLIDVQLVLPACFQMISVNVSCRLFAASDGVKSSVS